MTYIRSIWWDGFWIAGGVWIGLTLMGAAFLLPPGRAVPWGPFGQGKWALALMGQDPVAVALVSFFLVAIVLDTAHNVSPIVLTWTRPELRRIAFAQRRKYILLPAVIMLAASAIGAATSLGWTDFVPRRGEMYHLTLDWRNPFPWLAMTYASWEVYHFGMQNFGVVAIYCRKLGSPPRNRAIDKALCLMLTAALMVPPLLVIFGAPGMNFWNPPLYVVFLLVGLISAMHWLVAIGLGFRVSNIRWWLWLPLLFVIGTIGFGWTAASPHGTLLRSIPWLLSFRFGLGFVHFWYDGLIWRRGTPAMQAVLTPSA